MNNPNLNNSGGIQKKNNSNSAFNRLTPGGFQVMISIIVNFFAKIFRLFAYIFR
jgi:hypothetical protein